MAKMRLTQAINAAYFEEMERNERIVLFGEDVEVSMFGDTRGLHARFGSKRVRNTPISESAMTGMAVGAAMAGSPSPPPAGPSPPRSRSSSAGSSQTEYFDDDDGEDAFFEAYAVVAGVLIGV